MLARTHKTRGKESLVTQTLREFDGGWNVIDNDLNLQLKYSTELENVLRKDDGSLGIRWGTEIFATLPISDPEVIVNMEYFQDHQIVVTNGGNTSTGATVWRVGADGTPVKIWDNTLAAANNTPEITDAWAVSTDYLLHATVTDGGNYYVCKEAHTSGSTTLADDMTANPEWWELSVAGWKGNDFVSFATFYDHLIICNGVDKPLRVNLLDDPPCRYLVDEGTGGNGFIPVAKYVMVMNKFVLMAGDVLEPDLLYISSENTSGVWQTADDADPLPDNKAVNIRVTKKVNVNTRIINGIGRYRDNVVVAFDEVLAFGILGVMENVGTDVAPDWVHEPVFDDAIEAHGSIAHLSMQFLGDDLLMADLVGVASIARTALSDTLTPSRPSELIDPAIQQPVSQLSVGTAAKRIFSVYNLKEKQYMLFIPNHDDNVVTLALPEVIIANFDENEVVINAPDHNALLGECITIANCSPFNTFTDAEINKQHNIHTIIDADHFTIQPTSAIPLNPDLELTNQDVDTPLTPIATLCQTETFCYVLNHRKTGKSIKAWSRFRGWNWNCANRTLLGNVMFADDNRLFVYGSESNPLYEDFIGEPEQRAIDWSWELPWHDFKKRMETKRMKYLGMDTRGDSDYTISAFIDDIYTDQLGHLDPALQMHVYGRDAGGFGAGTQPYGGGRRMEGERLFAWPTKFKLLKLRFEGSSTRPLRLISILLALLAGSIRR